MEKENYISNQLKKKIKIYKFGKYISQAIFYIGAFLVFNMSSEESPLEKPKIIDEYRKAQMTLLKLESSKLTYEDYKWKIQQFPYKNKEIRFILGDDTQISKLEEAIYTVKNDISEIEKNSEYIEYNKKFDESKRKRTKKGAYGAITALFGLFTGMNFIAKETKLKRKLEALLKK